METVAARVVVEEKDIEKFSERICYSVETLGWRNGRSV